MSSMKRFRRCRALKMGMTLRQQSAMNEVGADFRWLVAIDDAENTNPSQLTAHPFSAVNGMHAQDRWIHLTKKVVYRGMKVGCAEVAPSDECMCKSQPTANRDEKSLRHIVNAQPKQASLQRLQSALNLTLACKVEEHRW